MIGKYLVNKHYILEASDWLKTSRYEHAITVHFINPGSAARLAPMWQQSAGVALPARPWRVKTNSGELKLYLILSAWRVEFIVQ